MLRYDRQTKPGLVALYNIRPGNGAGQFLQPRNPHGANHDSALDSSSLSFIPHIYLITLIIVRCNASSFSLFNDHISLPRGIQLRSTRFIMARRVFLQGQSATSPSQQGVAPAFLKNFRTPYLRLYSLSKRDQIWHMQGAAYS